MTARLDHTVAAWVLSAFVAAAPLPALGAAEPVSPALPAPAATLGMGAGASPAAAPAAGAPSPSAAVPARAPAPATEVARIWRTPGWPLAERVERTRPAARELGVGGYDAAARALLATGAAGPDLERAEAAVALAPDLPLAWGALARARLADRDPIGAARALAAGVRGLDRHLEASLWWRANAFHGAALAILGGVLAFLGVACAHVARRASHDLGDRVLPGAPEAGRALLLGCLVLLPAALGEGPLGLALGLFGLAFACGDRRTRTACVAGAALVALAVFPLLDRAGAMVAAITSDRVPWAAFAVEREAATPGELARLVRDAESDALAARALAVRARRAGDLAAADALYARLRAQGTPDPALVNNAANVRLALGDPDGAIELYDEVAAWAPSAVILFNLSHAHGAAIHPDVQDATLARAQALDADLVGELTDLLGTAQRGLVLDLPFPVPLLRARLEAGPAGRAAAGELRARLAPGRLGGSPEALGIAFGAAALAGILLTRKAAATSWCLRCGARRCPRCDERSRDDRLCPSCTRLLHRPDTTGTALRIERLNELRTRQRWRERLAVVASALIPGASGVLAGRPLLGLIGAVALCGAAIAWSGLHELLPDPLAAGFSGEAASALAALALVGLHAVASAWALALRRD